MAVIGARELQPTNILGSLVQGMEVGQQARAQRAKEAQADAAARQQQALNSLLQSGALSTPEGRNMLTRTPGGLDVLQAYGKTEESLGKGVQAQTEGLAGRMKYFRENVPFNPAQAPSWLTNAYSDPVVGAELRKMGSLEESLAAIPQDPAEYLKWLEGVSNLASQYAARRVPTAESMLPYEQPLTKDVEAQKIRIGQATRPVTTTSITNVAERAEAGEFGKQLVTDYTAIRDRAESGRRFLTTIDQAQRALNEGLRTGFGAETIKQGARILAALGEPEAQKNAANAELFLGAAMQNVLNKQIEQKGPQTESDAKRIEQTFISLGITPKANQFMLDVARAQINRDVEQQRFYSKWRRENNTFDGAEEAWLDSAGGKSLFDRPELKKYDKPQDTTDKPVKVKTVEEARNLPVGTLFETPDGRIKVR
jgi:hypothetical protein